MKISPAEIRQQEFSKKMRGFDPDEINPFLDKLADDLDDLQKENESLKLEIETLNDQLTEFKKIEKSIQDTLLKAQESSTRSLESSKKQTSLMIKEAELKASQIIEKARESANEIRNAVVNLREEKDLLIAKLKAIISSQANLLETKVEGAGNEPASARKKEENQHLDIDINDILNKLT
jgi:cell division initiation protein